MSLRNIEHGTYKTLLHNGSYLLLFRKRILQSFEIS